MTNKKPVIGLTSSYENKEETERIYIPHSYLDTIRHFGGIPLVLPAEANDEELELLIGLCDGLLLTGGHDIEPERYGEEPLNDTVHPTPVRDKMELKACALAVERKLPMLGICRGIQMMNVYFGGTLYQDIPSQLKTEVNHSMEKPYHRACHTCALDKASPLHALVGEEVIHVNSHHHQAVKSIAPGFAAMGCSEDGVVEAIWDPREPFRWGVQWHPERIWDIEESSAKLFEAFIAACQP